MASRLTCLEEELTCPVCHDIFKHPVVLSCSHSFCKDCVREWWMERSSNECPVCKIRCSSDHPPTNLIVKNLCENLLEEKGWRASSMGSDVFCAAHGEKLKLFCKDDKQLVCLVCRDSDKHTGHTFSPVDEASEHYKGLLKDDLWEKGIDFYDVCENYDTTEKHIKIQVQNTEMQIKEQFKILHQFLQEEEEARISALREEGTQKSQEIKERIEKLDRDMVALSDAIQAGEDQLRLDDHVLFLKNYKTTMKRVQFTRPCPKPVSGALIDEAKHLGNLAFSVWYKMKDIVSYTPVILDPNTAFDSILSADLTSVIHGNQERPQNPERLHGHAVLGYEGFNSGYHSWDVEIGDNREWEVGVKENLGREYRKWNLRFRKAVLKANYEHERVGEDHIYTVTDLPLKQNPRRIRVQLDWNRGELSFSDPDTNTHLHTFTHTFTHTLFPYLDNPDCNDMTLKMLPGKISVTLENIS